MNLSGFCSADAKDCGSIAPQSGASAGGAAPTYDQVKNSSYAAQAKTISDQVGGALYRIAAAAGKNVICPSLPVLGRYLGIGAATALGIGELVILGPAIGGATAFTGEVLGSVVGEHIGVETRKSLCGY
jgi:hypothetical protein